MGHSLQLPRSKGFGVCRPYAVPADCTINGPSDLA